MAAIAFAVDRLTKNWALTALGDGTSIPLLPTVDLRLAFNPGVAFSIGAGAGPILAVGIAVLLVGLLIWIGVQILRGGSSVGVILLAAALGGGAGNLYDRATRAQDGLLSGQVVDMIAVQWFAIFNVADIFTVCGLIGWVGLSIFRGPPASASEDAEV